ncbi:uncharacterized protein CLUP02_05918 [Colletotrichum lupini]|uniref:Uncharacterized protein n=1 Tax=Colletotrichum lupini TaxID=145971 RepID=A0A9Q8WF80_9PEZI|nr:uncharacterized protein CLUP02_05918 [Colletotrichum lupini]UQC80435.1 hypothetical protein CLUP02_05918 [Colletotrichum lupini]
MFHLTRLSPSSSYHCGYSPRVPGFYGCNELHGSWTLDLLSMLLQNHQVNVTRAPLHNGQPDMDTFPCHFTDVGNYHVEERQPSPRKSQINLSRRPSKWLASNQGKKTPTSINQLSIPGLYSQRILTGDRKRHQRLLPFSPSLRHSVSLPLDGIQQTSLPIVHLSPPRAYLYQGLNYTALPDISSSKSLESSESIRQPVMPRCPLPTASGTTSRFKLTGWPHGALLIITLSRTRISLASILPTQANACLEPGSQLNPSLAPPTPLLFLLLLHQIHRKPQSGQGPKTPKPNSTNPTKLRCTTTRDLSTVRSPFTILKKVPDKPKSPSPIPPPTPAKDTPYLVSRERAVGIVSQRGIHGKPARLQLLFSHAPNQPTPPATINPPSFDQRTIQLLQRIKAPLSGQRSTIPLAGLEAEKEEEEKRKACANHSARWPIKAMSPLLDEAAVSRKRDRTNAGVFFMASKGLHVYGARTTV